MARSTKIDAAKSRLNAAKRLVQFKSGAKLVKKPLSRYESLKGTLHGKLGLSIKQMMKATLPRTIQLMREGNVTVTSMRKSQHGFALMCKTITHHNNQATTSYKQIVQNLDTNTDSFSKSKWIKIDCTCLNYQFVRDYALWEKGSSDLNHALPEPPDETNPVIGGRRNLGICKHAFAVFQQILTRGL